MRTKSYWPRMDTDSHGYNKARAFFFLIRVHPRSSVANKVSLVLAQGSGHRNSMRSGVQRLISAASPGSVTVTGYTIRPPSAAVLACDFLPWGHDFLSLSGQLANAGLRPGDKLKHVLRCSRRFIQS